MGTPKDIVERAVELGWKSAALTEHGWLGSVIPFYQACRENKINPILGCEFYVVPDDALGKRGTEYRTASFHLTVLALSQEGYFNLVAWNNQAHDPENFYYKPRISIERMLDSAPHPVHHNVILSGCLGSELSQALLDSNGNGVGIAVSYVEALKSVFPNFYIELQNHYIGKFANDSFPAFQNLLVQERAVRRKLIELAEWTKTPMVVTNDSHFQKAGQRKAHIAMKASSWRHRDDSHMGKSQEQLISEYLPDYAYFGNYMRSMERVGRGLPSEALENANLIAQEANIRLDPLDNFSYSIPFSGYENPIARIRRRAKSRLEELANKHGVSATARFESELEAMGDFAHYLLLMSDFIIHARKQGILTNTRGSAANSILCYCLKIHDVDSIEYELTFERFYNPSRKKLPDIDIDIEADRYEDFMEFVQDRMEQLEGDGQVVPICNYGTLANRSAFRLAASALGIDKERQDEISKLLPQMIDSGMVDEESDVYEALKEQYPEIYDLATSVFDSIRNVSQHACGWLFGTAPRTVEDWVPLYLIASSGTLVTQYNLKSLEDLGLVKGDFLRLRSLSVIKRTLQLLGKNSLDLLQIPIDDPDTFEMLREGRTQGIFTLQGKENRRGCIECEVEAVRDVIASVAIYRPALTRPGYHRVFNARRKGEEAVSFPHEIAEEILGATHGLPVFQEQILELGYAIGMDHREVEEFLSAIKLAKGVGRGAKEAFEKIKPNFFEHALQHMDQEEANGVWNLIFGFQGYGFNKGHATSYGLLAVRSAYLKCHHPLEFFAALLDVYPEKSKYIAAARGEGYSLVAPNVNSSGAGFTLDRDSGAIRVGLSRIKGLGPVAISEIVRGSPFSSLDDFKARTTRRAVNVKRIEILAELDALVDFGIEGLEDEQKDSAEFRYLGFTTRKPKAFRGCKPNHVRARDNGGWVHKGREKGVELTEGKTSVSKLFWIPVVEKEKEILELKSSPWAGVKTWLLTVVDENGIPFNVMLNEDKPAPGVRLLKFLASQCQGSVICLDGAIRQPFLADGPQGFRFYGVTGARFHNDPQIWGVTKKFRAAINELERMRQNG
jgi:DNA polymerase-3 subunit alpha